MLKLLFLASVLSLAACVGPRNRVEITIQNTTSVPIEITGGSSILETSIVIMPGTTWSGWIDRRWISSSAWVKLAVK